MKIAHLADVHLDTAFLQFPAQVSRARRRGLRDAFAAALTHAQAEGVDAILIAGDLYEHDRVTADTADFLREQLGDVAPTPVFVAPGNHDWLGPSSVYATIDWSPNVHLFADGSIEPVELTPGLTLWGAAHRAPAGTRNFLDGFSVDRAGVNIALFHGSEQGEFVFQGEGKQPHAPFSEEDIRASGLDHAFVGHFHTPVDGSIYTYPGSLEPLTFGEDGSGGVVIAQMNEDGSVTRERIVVGQTRLWDVTVDVSGCSNAHAILERVRAKIGPVTGLARVTLTGSLDPDVDLDPGDVEACPGLDAVVVRFDNVYPDYDLAAIAEEPTVRGQFVRDVQEAQLDQALKQRVIVTGLRALEGRDDLEVTT